MSDEERLQPLALNPETATLDCGTCNFGGDDIFVNTENTIINFARQMTEKNVMVDMTLRLAAKGVIPQPLHFNFVMGINGGIAATHTNLLFLVNSLPQNATFTVSGTGRAQLPMAVMSMLLGGHVRVGFEDNVYLSKGRLLKSNGEMVEKIVRIAKELGREIAAPDEARELLGIPKKF